MSLTEPHGRASLPTGNRDTRGLLKLSVLVPRLWYAVPPHHTVLAIVIVGGSDKKRRFDQVLFVLSRRQECRA